MILPSIMSLSLAHPPVKRDADADFNLGEVNDLSDEPGSLSAAIKVCYHRY